MTWISLERLLLEAHPGRTVSFDPMLDHAQLCEQALRLAAGLHARQITRIAVHLGDAAELAIVLLGAWRAGVQVLLVADLQAQTRLRWGPSVDLWLTDSDTQVAELSAPEPMIPALLALDTPLLSLCTSGSSGEPKRIDKTLAQLANEVSALERLWGEQLGQACVMGSVATQHIYGLLFRLLWPLCAARTLLREQLPYPEDLQQASRLHTPFAWVTSPALLKRIGYNLDWAALAGVKKVFSSGGALAPEVAENVHARLGQRPTEILGSSETGGIAWRQADSLWQAFDQVVLGQDSEGALRIASPYLPAGHIEQSADAVEFAPDGRFRLLGRVDRIVKLEDKRISLPMLEEALTDHEWVEDARLGVVQDNRASLGALVALSGGGLSALRSLGRKALTQGLRHHLMRHCEALALPRRWRLVLQLPFNAQGKLPQAEIERLLREPRPQGPLILNHRHTDQGLVLHLQVPPDLAYFSGHFPTAPVLPGVVQVQWAHTLAPQWLDLPGRFAGMEVLKFQRLVRPGDHLELTLRFDAERSKLTFAFRDQGAPCSSGRLLLEPLHA